ncbi:hypothetical protein GCM10027160_29020 [Streptomyces calidiresistens]|uniref:Uncharacterized protein n=1 Tax=Streptomyces calidiresistens TaxID=1485586 RepID=A0A7W3T0A5_9ACTN|nr:hypothetical protein [Streptomyces calidiresistens]MBB0228520.1 hypothetical protein [Streptomyces calidiresistens]
MPIIEGAQPRPGVTRVLGVNAEAVVGRDDIVLSLASTNAETKEITLPEPPQTQAGHTVTIILRSHSSGAYEVTTEDGTVTLEAANHGVVLSYDGTAWRTAGLTGAGAEGGGAP